MWEFPLFQSCNSGFFWVLKKIWEFPLIQGFPSLFSQKEFQRQDLYQKLYWNSSKPNRQKLQRWLCRAPKFPKKPGAAGFLHTEAFLGNPSHFQRVFFFFLWDLYIPQGFSGGFASHKVRKYNFQEFPWNSRHFSWNSWLSGWKNLGFPSSFSWIRGRNPRGSWLWKRGEELVYSKVGQFGNLGYFL